MATHGNMGEYMGSEEGSIYMERLEFFFIANVLLPLYKHDIYLFHFLKERERERNTASGFRYIKKPPPLKTRNQRWERNLHYKHFSKNSEKAFLSWHKFGLFPPLFNYAGTSTIQQRQTWGRKVPGFGWATVGWASCIIDFSVQFKLLSDIRAWTQIWVQVQLGSSGPHFTKWADDQHCPAGLEPRLVPNLPIP